MTNISESSYPPAYARIDALTKDAGFTMASDPLTGALLQTLAASKPRGRLLELGTGTGLSTSWILAGMDKDSTLTSIDNDPSFLDIAVNNLGTDKRVQFVLTDGEKWILANKHRVFDYIFADTWHGKYLLLEETLGMLNTGGFYIIDDLLPQPNWPEGHDTKAARLIEVLEARKDISLTKLAWSTGIIIAVKR